MIRSIVKQLVEVSLGSRAAAGVLSGRTRGMDLVLAYHNVVPPGERAEGSQALHLPSQTFLEQMEVAGEHHELVSLRDLLSEPGGSRSRIAITFDDAYGGVINHALPELARLGIPATVFVAPAFVDGDAFWWDRISPPHSAGPDDRIRDHALWALKGRQNEIEAWAHSEGLPWREMPDHARCASISALQEHQLSRVDFGSHTWSHPNLAALDETEARDELARPREWLTESGLPLCDAIAYPYGLQNVATQRISGDLGYPAGLLIEGGWSRQGEREQLAVPRINVPSGLSTGGFRLRLSRLLS